MHKLRNWGLATLIVLALLCFLYATVVAQEDEWVKKADTPKAGGLGEAVVGTGDHIYALRCYSVGSCQFWRYNPTGDNWDTLLEWTPPDPLPRPKSGTALAWDEGDHIYALLGAAYGDANRTYFYRYSISGYSWEQLEEKRRYNQLALEMYPRLKGIVKEAEDRLAVAVKVAAAGNIIDLAILDSVDIEGTMAEVFTKGFTVDHLDAFSQRLAEAKRILYLSDNAGEIVFDKILVEELLRHGKEVTFAVKEAPILNGEVT